MTLPFSPTNLFRCKVGVSRLGGGESEQEPSDSHETSGGSLDVTSGATPEPLDVKRDFIECRSKINTTLNMEDGIYAWYLNGAR